jgi:hypothetical protein
MMRLVPLALLAAAIFSANAEAQGRRQPAGPPGPCAAATAKVEYGRLLQVPDSLKSDVEAYRAGWREACAKKKGGAALHALLARGDAINKAFVALIDKSGIKETKYEELHELLGTAYPKFIPAFTGSMIEYEYFEPDLAVFARQAGLGDEEDKLFFASHRQLYGTDPHSFPWLNRTSHVAGCVRFGTFDWVAAAARIEGLEAKLKAPAYRQRIADLKDRIQSYLGKPAVARDAGKKPVVDSCVPKARTITELEKIAKALGARKGWEKTAAGLRKTVEDIRANRTDVCNGCSAS